MCNKRITITTEQRQTTEEYFNTMAKYRLPTGARGIRCALLIMNTFNFIAGAVLSVLGREIDHFLNWTAHLPDLPKLWWAGIPPIIIGVAGCLAAVTNSKIWVMLWVIVDVILGVTMFAALTSGGCLESQKYGIAPQIFGVCQERYGTCICERDDARLVVLEFSTCTTIRHLTSVYIGVVLLLILIFTVITCSAVLGCVACCCVHKCQNHDDRDVSGTTCGGAENSPMVVRLHTKSYSFYSLAPD